MTICFPALGQLLPRDKSSLQHSANFPPTSPHPLPKPTKTCSSSLSVLSFSNMLFRCPLSQQGGIGQSSGLGGGVTRTSGIGGGGIIRTSHTYTSSSQMPSCAAAEIQGKSRSALCQRSKDWQHQRTPPGGHRGWSEVSLWGWDSARKDENCQKGGGGRGLGGRRTQQAARHRGPGERTALKPGTKARAGESRVPRHQKNPSGTRGKSGRKAPVLFQGETCIQTGKERHPVAVGPGD